MKVDRYWLIVGLLHGVGLALILFLSGCAQTPKEHTQMVIVNVEIAGDLVVEKVNTDKDRRSDIKADPIFCVSGSADIAYEVTGESPVATTTTDVSPTIPLP